ncbi:MAG: hypothetical protein MUC51_09485 [Anaerolineae bacterium]|nr:hypothetical protein [Anaerolineae bacterium]
MSDGLRLNSLASAPDAQSNFAVALLQPRQKRDVLLAALKVLAKYPNPAAREPIRQLFEHFSADGRKRDPGAFTRRAVLDAWRPIALSVDVPLILQAVNTYEFLPPGFKEDAILLRTGALLILNELDDTLAGFQATRLLVDGFSDPMSGEPALTAVRVLASQEQTLPLYLYAMQASNATLGATLPEVVSECLRSLTRAPAALIPGIIARHGKAESAVIRIGLCDLLIGHEAGAQAPLASQAVAYLGDALTTMPDLAAYRYLVIAMLTARRAELAAAVLQTARLETHRGRIAVLLELLDLFATNPEIAALAEQLRLRR